MVSCFKVVWGEYSTAFETELSLSGEFPASEGGGVKGQVMAASGQDGTALVSIQLNSVAWKLFLGCRPMQTVGEENHPQVKECGLQIAVGALCVCLCKYMNWVFKINECEPRSGGRHTEAHGHPPSQNF